MPAQDALTKVAHSLISPVLLAALAAALLLPSGPVPRAHAARVSEKEAIELAEFWHPAEVNYYYKKGWKRDREKQSKLLNETSISRVRYLVGRNALVDKPKQKKDVLAYVIEFEPAGHLVIAADDRFTPLLAFGFDSVFIWEGHPQGDPEHNFMRMFLNSYADAAKRYLWRSATEGDPDQPLEAWSNLRTVAQQQEGLPQEEKSYVQQPTDELDADQMLLSGTPDPSVADVELPTATWDQFGFYNDEVINHVWWAAGGAAPLGFPDAGPGEVPTGCNATALAIILRYHEWPVTGRGSFTHNDTDGDVHGGGTVDYFLTTYNWSNMPTSNINTPGTPDFGANADIAELMYHAGILTAANWEVRADGTGGDHYPAEWNTHLRYKSTVAIEAYSDTPSPEPFCQYETLGAYEYFFCDADRLWLTAQLHCMNASGRLVDIRNEEENDFIEKQMVNKGISIAWIGANDVMTEGDWEWALWAMTGELFWQNGLGGGPTLDPSGAPYYTNWPAWEPDDNPTPADCAYVTDSGLWITTSCDFDMAYICKRPVDSAAILDPIRDSVVGGLPVHAGVEGIGDHGHAVVIDGYRTFDPLGWILRVNVGWGNTSGWYAINNIPGGPILINAAVYQTPENYIYVDGSYSGAETGELMTPYHTVNAGANMIPTAYPGTNPKGGRLWIKAGYYTGTGNSPLTILKPMEISSYSGDVNIGNRLYLKHSGSLRLAANAGTLRIRP